MLGGSGTVDVIGLVVLTDVSTAASLSIAPLGTLQVGNGGTTGLLASGSVANSGTLAFNRYDVATHGAFITGAGTLTHLGSGTTTLANYQGTGPINVSNGQLGLTNTNGCVDVSGGGGGQCGDGDQRGDAGRRTTI